MNTIAEYVEKQIMHYRHFRLTSDRIYLSKTKGIGARYEMSFMLHNLDSERDRYWVSDQNYSTALLLLFIICFIIFLLILKFVSYSFLYTILAFVVLFGPVGIGMFFSKRTEYSSFVSTNGNRVFDIGKVGRNRDDYDGFVEKIVYQIKQCSPNKSAQKGQPGQSGSGQPGEIEQ